MWLSIFLRKRNRRGHQRGRPILQAARIASETGSAPAIVMNISDGGLMLRTPLTLVPGDYVTVDITGLLPLSGKVAWSEGDQGGIEFHEPIDSSSLLYRLPTAVGGRN